MFHSCIISLAANCNQEKNLAEARSRLSKILFSAKYTAELWTQPITSSNQDSRHAPDSSANCLSQPPYLNQLVYARTRLSIGTLERRLKETERMMGRTAEARQQGIVCIDLDLMQYDDVRYHLRDWERPYIQQLIANSDSQPT